MSDYLSVSIVSHGQMQLVFNLLEDIQACCFCDIGEIILTINVNEDVALPQHDFCFPIRIIRNSVPKGFGANHNAAFKTASGDFFCVLNPDVRLSSDPFPSLLEFAAQDGIGAVAPAIVTPFGIVEDSARKFPSLTELIRKFFGGKSVVHKGSDAIQTPDWIAGMFMLFPRAVFEEMGGFDERYFLYYEDVDLCARLALKGYRRLVCTNIQVVHDAQRASHKKMRYALIHLRSILRFFTSDVYCQLKKKISR